MLLLFLDFKSNTNFHIFSANKNSGMIKTVSEFESSRVSLLELKLFMINSLKNRFHNFNKMF